MNPAYGRAVEAARAAAERAPREGRPREEDEGAHWVTIDGHHVLIHQAHARRQRHVSARDTAYLDKYYDAVSALAKVYNVDPALVLGVGIESSFASQGTYLQTGDAFGMTGGSPEHMTKAASPSENVKQFFDNYGNQIRGVGSDASAFLNGLQGRTATGKRVKGWKTYNTANPDWSEFIGSGIDQMRRDIPTFLTQRKPGHVAR